MKETLLLLITRKIGKKEKKKKKKELQDGKCHPFYFPTKSPLENNQL